MSMPKNHKPGRLQIGGLSRKVDGQHFIPKREEFPPPERVCNASSQELLTDYAGQMARTEQRPGCLDARKCKSVGVGC